MRLVETMGRLIPALSMPEDTVEEATGSVDVETLERIARRLDGSTRFTTVVSQPAYAPNAIVAE